MKFFIKFGCILLMILSSMTSIVNANTITDQPYSETAVLLDTVVQLSVYHEEDIAQPAIEAAIEYISSMESLLNVHDQTSEASEINHSAGDQPVELSQATIEVLEAAIYYGELTERYFDITIGPLVQLWGIGSEDARLPDEEEIQAAVDLIDLSKLQLDLDQGTAYLEQEGMAIDLGGIAKGYIADGVKSVFESYGVSTAIINLGGNVVVMGSSPTNEEGWNIGVQNPFEVRGDIVGTYRIKDGSIVTSGIYERYLEVDGEKYHHILNPHTGYPVDNELVAVTIFSRTSLEGDGLSTGVFALGLKDGMALVDSLEGVEAIFISKNHDVVPSAGVEDFEVTHENYQLVMLDDYLGGLHGE